MPWEVAMSYVEAFSAALDTLRVEGRYRVFANILRTRGAFPAACHPACPQPRRSRSVTVLFIARRAG